MVITGMGGTDFYPSAQSDAETLIVTLQVVVGAFMWTRVLALFCDIAVNSSPGLTAFRQTLDSINDFVGHHALPKDVASRIREYLNQQKGLFLRGEAAKSVAALSIALQIEVRACRHAIRRTYDAPTTHLVYPTPQHAVPHPDPRPPLM